MIPMPKWLKRTPPHCLRHVTPWWLLDWLDKRLPFCWASVVTWKAGSGAMPGGWWPNHACFAPDDYCGKFQPEQGEQVVSPKGRE